MRIKQQDNGNIIISDTQGQITHVLSSMSVQKHPRKANAILICSKDFQCGQKGIEFLANQRIYINDKRYYTNADALLTIIGKSIVTTGIKPKTTASSSDSRPTYLPSKYVEYINSNTYERLLGFAKRNSGRYSTKTYDANKKLIGEKYICQFKTFTITVYLRYMYRSDNQIDYIIMWGDTQYVLEPKKVYRYDAKNRLTGYVYKQRLQD